MPSVGGDESTPEDREKAAEQEKLRQEAIKQAEQERRVKHKKMEEQRENMRQGIRDRVSYRFALIVVVGKWKDFKKRSVWSKTKLIMKSEGGVGGTYF